MEKIRINNDIDIVVELKDEAGEVMQPQSLRNIAVVLSTGLKKHKVENFTLLSNGVGFRFRASEQARTGVYDISVTAETADGRAFATDVCKAFELVACSCEAGGEAGKVEVESVSVTATFAITAFAGAGGGVTVETDPVFSASPAAQITEENIEAWNGKQDAISDLEKIRWGAQKGMTALQEEQYKGTVTGIKMNGQTKGLLGVVDLGTVLTEHQDISGKQDKLVSGENIKTINGQSVLGEGDIVIEGGDVSGDYVTNEVFQYFTSFNGGDISDEEMTTPDGATSKVGYISTYSPHVSDLVGGYGYTWTVEVDGATQAKIIKVTSSYVGNDANFGSTLAFFNNEGKCLYHNYALGTFYILVKRRLTIRATVARADIACPFKIKACNNLQFKTNEVKFKEFNDKVKETLSLKSDVFYALASSVESEPITYNGSRIINANGEYSNWGPGIATMPIELKDKHVILIDRVGLASTKQYLVAFYDENDALISEYNQFYYDNGSGKVTPESNVIIVPSDYPLAKYVRISYVKLSGIEPIVKDVNLNKNEQKLWGINEIYNYIKIPFDSFYEYKSQKYIDENGGFSNWGGCRVYRINLPLPSKAISFSKLVSVSYNGHLIAFYKGNDEYISSLISGKNITVNDILLKESDIPSGTEYILFYSLERPVTLYQLDVENFYKEFISRIGALENIVSVSNNIVVEGDSIGNQIGTALVRNLVNIGDKKFVNNCTGGESCIDTLAKNGYYPYLAAPFTIPATAVASEAVELYPAMWLRETISPDGESVTYHSALYSGENNDKTNPFGNGINAWDKLDCTVGGIEGTMYFKRASTNRANNYFIRKTSGEEITLTTPTYVVPMNVDKASPRVIFMGTNGGWNPIDIQSDFNKCADILVNYYETIARELGHNNYLFLGFYMTAYLDQVVAEERIRRWAYFESKMVEKFGKHYFSVRQYLRTQGWRDSGYQLGFRLVDDGNGGKKYTCLDADIAEDRQAIADGKIPYCIVNGSSGVHMLSKPSAAVANEVVKRLYELGIVDNIRQIDVSAILDAENADINEPDYGEG